MELNTCTLETCDEPRAETSRAAREAFRRNMDWLQHHWGDVLPAARGRYVAVAGQEAFVADTLMEAAEWARARHPQDPGPVLEFVLASEGSRIYASSW